MKKTTGDLTVELVEENKALKSQLANIKYLNANEVEKIFKKYCYDQSTRDYFDDVNAIDAILNLAIPDIELDSPIAPPNKSFTVDIQVGKIEDGKPSIPDIISIDELSKELGMRDLTKEEAKAIDKRIEDLYYPNDESGGAGIGYKPRVDRKKIIKILHEFVKYQIEADNLINNEAVEYVADEIITALEGK